MSTKAGPVKGFVFSKVRRSGEWRGESVRKTKLCAGEEEKKTIWDPIFDGWQQLIWIFLAVLSSLSMLCPLHFHTAFIQKSTSGIILHSCPHRSFYTWHRSLCTGQKKHLNPNRFVRRGRVFWGVRRWPFSGRSTTFCATSIGQHISIRTRAKRKEKSQAKS